MAVLSAPSNVVATLTWPAGVPTVTVTFNAVSGATGYRLTRRLQSSTRRGNRTVGILATSTTLTDAGASLASNNFWYSVYAIDSAGDHGRRSPDVPLNIPATDPGGGVDDGDGPDPEPGDLPLPPVNVRLVPTYDGGRATDIVQWDPRSGATAYKVYWYENTDQATPIQSGMVASPLYLGSVAAPATQFLIPGTKHYTYNMVFVTSVDSASMESIPSASAEVEGPITTQWNAPYTTPYDLRVRSEWNNGSARILLRWRNVRGRKYAIYRSINGAAYSQLCVNIPRQYYLDESVVAGNTYTYKVTSGQYVATTWVEGSQSSASPSAAPLTAQPQQLSDSWSASDASQGNYTALISYSQFPQAQDYRIYPQSVTADQNSKYAGGPAVLSMQANGLTNGSDTAFYVEALDKEGPYQMQNRHFPGLLHGAHAGVKHVNGVGDPSNVPNVLKRITSNVQGTSTTLSGAQAFFDNFGSRGEFFDLTSVTADRDLVESAGYTYPLATNHHYIRAYQNGDATTGWGMFLIGNDMANCNCHVHAKHLMTNNSDGNTPNSGGPRANNNGKMFIFPRKDFDFTTDTKILHVTWFVDPSFTPSNRRWVGLLLKSRQTANGGDWGRVFEEFTDNPAESGYLQLSTFFDHHRLTVNNGSSFGSRWTVGHSRSAAQNSTDFLDKRVKFDFYFRRSDGKFQFFENGVRQNSFGVYSGTGAQTIDTTKFALPAYSDVQVCWFHATYHLDSDKKALQHDHNSNYSYYIDHNYRMDERHWHDMGYEEVAAFPV